MRIRQNAVTSENNGVENTLGGQGEVHPGGTDICAPVPRIRVSGMRVGVIFT